MNKAKTFFWRKGLYCYRINKTKCFAKKKKKFVIILFPILLGLPFLLWNRLQKGLKRKPIKVVYTNIWVAAPQNTNHLLSRRFVICHVFHLHQSLSFVPSWGKNIKYALHGLQSSFYVWHRWNALRLFTLLYYRVQDPQSNEK